jgi:hypothetical protein
LPGISKHDHEAMESIIPVNADQLLTLTAIPSLMDPRSAIVLLSALLPTPMANTSIPAFLIELSELFQTLAVGLGTLCPSVRIIMAQFFETRPRVSNSKRAVSRPQIIQVPYLRCWDIVEITLSTVVLLDVRVWTISLELENCAKPIHPELVPIENSFVRL